MSDSDQIDWEQLSMIFGEDEDDFDEEMAELFQEFIADGSQRFVAIRSTPFEADRVTIAKESHKLKGSASNFGFSRVAKLLGHIEDNIASISPQEYETSIGQAQTLFKASIQEVVARYPGLGQGCLHSDN